MTEMMTGVAAGTVALVLLGAFAGHLLRPRALPAALTAHRTVPAPLARPVAIAVGGLEGLLGAMSAYSLLTGRPRVLETAAAGSAVLFAAYALYGLYVLRTRPGVPCGCAAGETPMSGWAPGRAAVLALASAAAAVGAEPATAAHGARAAIVALSSVTFATLLLLLPLAMSDPERSAVG